MKTKTTLKPLLTVLMVAVLLFPLFAKEPLSVKKIPKVNKTLPFSKGINLTLWLEHWDDIYATFLYDKQAFINIKSLGVEAVRLPIHFEKWNFGKPDYILEPYMLDLLDKAVIWTKELKMYLIIDFHNDCGHGSKTSANIEKILTRVWEQIATRYKNEDNHIIYEIMNEPHIPDPSKAKTEPWAMDTEKWGKIQNNIIKIIRSIDSKHAIVVGGGDYSSIESMLTLPEYDDDNLIYTFHDYSPFMFTHQGAEWTYIQRIQNVPFPYVKEKMPPLPLNPTKNEKRIYESYEEDSDEDVLCEPLNKAVEFANERNAYLLCGEFGVYMKYANPQERVNWYKLKIKWMDDRNISRLSWDYTGSNGLFISTTQIDFPKDLNIPLVKAMGYKIPNKQHQRYSWIDNANKTYDYSIYKNGLAKGLALSSWSETAVYGFKIFAKDNNSNETYLSLKNASAYSHINIIFKKITDFTPLKNKNAELQFYIRTKEPDFKAEIFFKNSELNGRPWRAYIYLNKDNVKPDGLWHLISVKLSEMKDDGAWDDNNKKWYNGNGEFRWADIEALIISAGKSKNNQSFDIKDIKIVF